jgi:DUF438 domain-containing protein
MGIEFDSKAKQLKKFAKLDEGWRSDQLSKQTPDIFKTISATAIANVQLDIAKDLDEDLARLQDEFKTAGEGYKLGRKENNLKIQFLVQVLSDRGENLDGLAGLLKQAAEQVAKQGSLDE